ncbi:MAG TPA: hypothetical protein VIL20_23185 [Sandaracinaceae bacterium]
MRLALVAALLCAGAPALAAAQDAAAPAEGDASGAEARTAVGGAPDSRPADDGPRDETGDASAVEASEREASGDEASERRSADGGRAESDGDASERDASDAPSDGAAGRDQPAPSTDVAGALGVATVAAAVGALASLWIWVARDGDLGLCATYEAEEPRYRGCLNVDALREQRDLGAGFALGFAGVALATGVAWAIVAATRGSPSEDAALRCAPGPLSVACAGRF